jgi:hypothetical protein
MLEEKLSSPKSTDKESNFPISKEDDIIKQSEDFATENELFNSVLELSKKEAQNNKYLSSKKEVDLTIHPSVLFIQEMGFTLEEAILAYSAVGEDPEHMLQYLYSLNMH